MKSPAWQRKEGKSASGGLNAKGRASYNAETGGNLKPPVKSGDNPQELDPQCTQVCPQLTRPLPWQGNIDQGS